MIFSQAVEKEEGSGIGWLRILVFKGMMKHGREFDWSEREDLPRWVVISIPSHLNTDRNPDNVTLQVDLFHHENDKRMDG